MKKVLQTLAAVLWLALTVGLFLLFSQQAHGQEVPITGIALNQQGMPIPNANVRICSASALGTPCSPTVPLFADQGRTQPVTNPLPFCTAVGQQGCADAIGNFMAWTDPAALFQIQITLHGHVFTYYTTSGVASAFQNGAGTGYQDVPEINTPTNPAPGFQRLFGSNQTHQFSCILSSGASCATGSSGTTVSVNSLTVTNPNFNGTTPTPPANAGNCTWQVSGSNVSCYLPPVSALGPGIVTGQTCPAGQHANGSFTNGVPNCSADTGGSTTNPNNTANPHAAPVYLSNSGSTTLEPDPAGAFETGFGAWVSPFFYSSANASPDSLPPIADPGVIATASLPGSPTNGQIEIITDAVSSTYPGNLGTQTACPQTSGSATGATKTLCVFLSSGMNGFSAGWYNFGAATGAHWFSTTTIPHLDAHYDGSVIAYNAIVGADINQAGQVTNGSHVTNSSIPNSGLVNTGTTVNGIVCTLGASCSVGGGGGNGSTFVTPSNQTIPATTITNITGLTSIPINAGSNPYFYCNLLFHQTGASAQNMTFYMQFSTSVGIDLQSVLYLSATGATNYISGALATASSGTSQFSVSGGIPSAVNSDFPVIISGQIFGNSSGTTVTFAGQVFTNTLTIDQGSFCTFAGGPSVNTVIDNAASITVTNTFPAEFHHNQEATAATAVTYTLPTAATGLQKCFDNSYNGSAADTGVLTIATSATGQFIIFTDGTLSATGGNVTSGGAGGDAACVVGVDTTHWQLYVQRGTWTKH